jgi:pilus assembly protein Flp/PilA
LRVSRPPVASNFPKVQRVESKSCETAQEILKIPWTTCEVSTMFLMASTPVGGCTREATSPLTHSRGKESAMKRVISLLREEEASTAVEYAVMLALIVIVCLAAIGSIGTNAKTTFTNVANSLGS